MNTKIIARVRIEVLLEVEQSQIPANPSLHDLQTHGALAAETNAKLLIPSARVELCSVEVQSLAITFSK